MDACLTLDRAGPPPLQQQQISSGKRTCVMRKKDYNLMQNTHIKEGCL
jgi:hypothetical protein